MPPAFDSSRRVRWLSGVSCTSSSASGGEESPRPGNSTRNYVHSANTSLSELFSNGCPPQHHSQTSTPVNGWLESTRPVSQALLKEDKPSASVDGAGSVNSMHSVSADSRSFHKSLSNSNMGSSFSGIPAVERLYPGIGHIQDNRPWPSVTESRWNSRVSVPEPFWAATTALFHPQSDGVSPLHSPQSGACLMTAAQTGGGVAVGSQTPLSVNGGFTDATNSMQTAANVSPSSAATTPSKKRVCIILEIKMVLQIHTVRWVQKMDSRLVDVDLICVVA